MMGATEFSGASISIRRVFFSLPKLTPRVLTFLVVQEVLRLKSKTEKVMGKKRPIFTAKAPVSYVNCRYETTLVTLGITLNITVSCFFKDNDTHLPA